QGADRADRDRACFEIEGERLPDADEDDDRDQARDVAARAEDETRYAGDDSRDRDERDEGRERRREREEVWPRGCVRALLLCLSELTCARLREAGRRGDVFAVLGHRG